MPGRLLFECSKPPPRLTQKINRKGTKNTRRVKLSSGLCALRVLRGWKMSCNELQHARRPLGNSGLMVSPVALGCWPIAGVTTLGVNDADSIATIQKCFDV